MWGWWWFRTTCEPRRSPKRPRARIHCIIFYFSNSIYFSLGVPARDESTLDLSYLTFPKIAKPQSRGVGVRVGEKGYKDQNPENLLPKKSISTPESRLLRGKQSPQSRSAINAGLFLPHAPARLKNRSPARSHSAPPRPFLPFPALSSVDSAPWLWAASRLAPRATSRAHSPASWGLFSFGIRDPLVWQAWAPSRGENWSCGLNPQRWLVELEPWVWILNADWLSWSCGFGKLQIAGKRPDAGGGVGGGKGCGKGVAWFWPVIGQQVQIGCDRLRESTLSQ